VKEACGSVDVCLELVGETTFSSALRCLAPTGTLVVIGNISLAKVQMSLGPMILFEHKVVGSSGATKAELEQIFQMVQQGKLKPIIHSEFPLSISGVQSAHKLLKEKSVMGRVVLRSRL
jgi:NADPH:quinone reductase-like Zn-dependent oxidoreductase